MLTKDNILSILECNGFKKSDTVMIHSSLKSIGEIEGGVNTLIETLKEYFSDGLIIFPTHTWLFMKEDNQILDLEEANSCVGALTNIALKSGFKRSFHPTHSVCAYGKNVDEYLAHDNTSFSPVSPSGCFGVLSKMKAKIVFLGAKLSKNTFIHSLEERYNVSDRFTSHVYHFYSKYKDEIKEYNMPKHYSSLNPHISDNYLKLEEPMMELSIAYKFNFGLSQTIVVDAYKCDLFVSYLLEKNIHIFDDAKDIDKNIINEYKAINNI